VPPEPHTVVEKMPPSEAKVPPLQPRQEELLAVGAAGEEILVSSTEGVYVFSSTGVRLDESVLPHQLLKFVPWGTRIWAETNGGVLLRENGRWREFPWSRNLNMKEPAFARVAVRGDTAWGVFGRHLLRWNKDATAMDVITKRKAKGVWERRGGPLPEETQAILALPDSKLLLATSASKLYTKQDIAEPRTQATVSYTKGEDPLLLELARDAAGATWGLYFGGGGGLFRIYGGAVKLVRRAQSPDDEHALPPGTILRALTDARKRLYVLHEGEGVFRYRFGRWERVGSKPPENTVDMAFHPDGILLLTEKRLLRLNNDESEELHVFKEVSMTSTAPR
jgi:hypothetical protein